MKYRSRTEIVAMILEAANGGATKTRIMYKAFLSYAQLREYLSVLIENNLLEYLEGSQTYKTTEKGLNFLKMHNEIGELVQTSVKIKEGKIRRLFLYIFLTFFCLFVWNYLIKPACFRFTVRFCGFISSNISTHHLRCCR